MSQGYPWVTDLRGKWHRAVTPPTAAELVLHARCRTVCGARPAVVVRSANVGGRDEVCKRCAASRR